MIESMKHQAFDFDKKYLLPEMPLQKLHSSMKSTSWSSENLTD